jgi:hypothetical protein
VLRLYGKLHLKVNESKSAVASVLQRKPLGYGFWVAPSGTIKRRVADKPMTAFKPRVRRLTRRSGGRSLAEVVKQLRVYVMGWKANFRLAQTPRVWQEPDPWMRHRIRAIQLKHWETQHHRVSGTDRVRSLVRGGGTSGGQYPPLVAQQLDASQLGAKPGHGRTGWGYPVSVDLNFSNRPVRTRMPGGVAGESGYPLPLCRFHIGGVSCRSCLLHVYAPELAVFT